MPSGKRAAPRAVPPRLVAALVVAALTLPVAGFAAAGPGRQWLTMLLAPEGSQPARPASPQACAREIQAGRTTLGVARTGVAHWEAHVQARTDLLAGENTAAETDAIWSRTRLAGPTDLRRFRRADRGYRRVAGPACSRPGGGGRGQRREMVHACSTRARLTDRAVAASRAAIADWESHQANMAAFADHEFGVEHAQRMWEKAWSTASPNINAFHRALRRLRQAPSCPQG